MVEADEARGGCIAGVHTVLRVRNRSARFRRTLASLLVFICNIITFSMEFEA